MKNAKLTFFVVGMAVILVFMIFVSISGGMESYALTDDYEEIVNVDPLVTKLQAMLLNSDELRIASLDSSELTNEMMLKHILLSMNKEDYSVSFIRPEKITCYVTKGIMFTSEEKCEIRKIKNEKIMEYQKRLFNTSKELQYDEINFQGMHCVNDGEKYYCHINEYVSDIKSYSLIDKVYKHNDNIYMYEYYIMINLADTDKCLKYFTRDYCSNYKDEKNVTLSNDVVKNNGVYYKHIFKLNDMGEYYLSSSEVVVS